MAEINLQCNNLSQIHSSVFFRMKTLWQVEHTWGKCWTKFGWNTSRDEWVIGQTSECTKRENFRGSRKLPQAHEKSVRWKWKKENDARVKYYWWKEGIYRVSMKNSCHGYQPASTRWLLIQWRYYLFSRQVNGCLGDGFSSVGAWTVAIKLAMAGTQDWWRRFPPLLVCWFYMVRTCWVLDN